MNSTRWEEAFQHGIRRGLLQAAEIVQQWAAEKREIKEAAVDDAVFRSARAAEHALIGVSQVIKRAAEKE